MVLKIIEGNKLIGFTYYPILENILGVFFLFMSFYVPILFYKYNGLKLQQWDEWLFIIIFFIVFLILGKNLGYQNMKVVLKDKKLSLMQDMREPSVNLVIDVEDWNGLNIEITDLTKNGDEKMYDIRILDKNEPKEFYKTKSLGEYEEITCQLYKIYNENKGEGNGTN